MWKSLADAIIMLMTLGCLLLVVYGACVDVYACVTLSVAYASPGRPLSTRS